MDQTVQQLLASVALRRDQFRFTTRHRCSPRLQGEIVARLNSLSRSRETRPARAEVDAALGCAWWGLRLVAIRVIGRWGGAANKIWLMQRSVQIAPLQDRKVLEWCRLQKQAARHAIGPLLDVGDAAWMLDLFIGDPDTLYHAEIMALPDEVVSVWVPAQLRQTRGEARVRLAMLVTYRTTLPDRMHWLRTLAAGDDASAELLRRWFQGALTEGE